jgi:integrase
MANIQERRDKSGKLISYSIRVHRGRGADGKQLPPYTTTFEVSSGWSEKTARKRAETFAANFERDCKAGLIGNGGRQTFQKYGDYVLSLKELEVKHSSLYRYRELSKRIYDAIGYIRLCDLRADHLNAFYADLMKPGANARTGKGLSGSTVLKYHNLISTILDQAVREGLIAVNVADRAMKPKAAKPKVQYFQPEQIDAIRDALELEPLKWKMLTHLLLITGARRGEVLGLKWPDVDFDENRVHICNNIQYRPDRGVYEETPKTETSIRYITLPVETMQLLRQYRAWQASERLRLGAYYQDQGFVFAQDNGGPMHPDSVTTWLDKFSKRHGLPHIHPHAFRHTMASLLYCNGVDGVSISKRLGHAQVSTTANIYAHVVEEADQRNADILSEVFLRKKTSLS